ncbi:hypothetical protein HPB48_019265 [Haemaphysalis longicornis]|uniref:CRAL/TRIO N-terminal domain-containing protein n=1 Tax=Haemaphysalis longicornis TaxID=44386 RepID=A0A9J6GC25_HAELO|nr:hypothetical protein HPB48_019265 [Haemaphysalis longicornis]
MSTVGSMSKELEEVARLELGETPEVKQQALKRLRELLSGEPLLKWPSDDAFLVKFLRARKYNVERACDTIKKYFTCRRENPDIFEGLTPATFPFDVACRQQQLFTVSRKKDSKGRVVFLINAGVWDGKAVSATEFFKVDVVHVEHMLLDEEAQIKGFVAVFNLKGLGVPHLALYTPSNLRKLCTCSEKMRELLPDDLIPEEYGGSLERYDYDDIKRELESETKLFEDLNRLRLLQSIDKFYVQSSRGSPGGEL